MKTLFFISAFVGFVYLVVQSSFGQSWLSKFDSNSRVTPISVTKEQQFLARVVALETEMKKLSLLVNQQAELVKNNQARNALIASEPTKRMDNLNEASTNQTESAANIEVRAANQNKFRLAKEGGPDIDQHASVTSANNERAKRIEQQAKLKDVINKMELASLHLLAQ
ncbi:hypothetical protein [Glaciecola sp. KUL10]|uniref:hypothetical protein n=1 Tax=Glaciecola sp. (strain KUL10) TaxID=2161813 RepID=UPI000D7897F4|nr:hypothetical protein [Glaciecola sp. KUL10]GBL05403.1 hypothetical protein KUL10_27230 [Glaciecola sp. KUL10]